MLLRVSQIMSSRVITTSPDTKVPQIWKLIFSKKIHGLPVVDKNKKLLGIISEEDILSRLYPDISEVVENFSTGFMPEDLDEKLAAIKHLTARDIMNRRVIYARPETLIMRALSRMIVRQVRQLPVLDDDDRVIGMISKGDIFDNLFKLGKKSFQKIRPK